MESIVTPNQMVSSFFKEKLNLEELNYILTLLKSDKAGLKDVDFINYVYEHGDEITNSNNYSCWQENIAILKLNFNQEKDIISQLENFIDSAIVQYQIFMKQTEDMTYANKQSSEALKNAQEKLEETSKQMDAMLTQYVSILGIFATLVFGMFGGFDSLKEILSNIHAAPITTVLICFSSLMLGLLCLIFLLIQSIARLTGKDTLSCKHHGNVKECNCALINKYPIFIYSTLIFVIIFLISCLVRFFNYKALYKCSPNFYNNVAIIILIFLGIGVFIAVRPKRILKRILKKIENLIMKFKSK